MRSLERTGCSNAFGKARKLTHLLALGAPSRAPLVPLVSGVFFTEPLPAVHVSGTGLVLPALARLAGIGGRVAR